MAGKRERASTQRIELVQTDRIMRALTVLDRKCGAQGMRRALYHSLLVAGCLGEERERRIREALGLP